MFLIRLAAALAVLTAPVAAAPAGAKAVAGGTDITCTNPYSGATWRIRLDTARGTVDAYPARIGTDEISWHDAKDGGNYTLDRHSGALTVVLASSTGGYFLHDNCRMPP